MVFLRCNRSTRVPSPLRAEGVHPLVDIGNGGSHRSRHPQSPPASRPHAPFGQGKKLYFWTLIVAVLSFGLGGGVSLYEGIRHLQHPEPVTDPIWAYGVLIAAMVFEGYA